MTTNFKTANTFIQSQSIDPSGLSEERVEITALESNTHLKSIVEYTLPDGERVGALLLNVGSDKQEEFRLRFFWEFEGIAPNLDETEAIASELMLAALFESLPIGENLRIELQIFSNYEHRFWELYGLFDRAAPTSQYLIAEEIKHLQDIDAAAERRNHRIIISATYSGCQSDRKSILNLIFSKAKEKTIDDLLFDGIEKGYSAWSELLSERLSGRVRPLTGERVWHHCWEQLNRFNDRALELEPEPFPQMLRVDLRDRQIIDCVRNVLHPVTVMMRYPSAIPLADRDCVGVDGKLVSAMSAISLPIEFNSSECSGRERLAYLWEAIELPQASDCRFLLEVTKSHKNPQLTNFSLCIFIYRDELSQLRKDTQKIANYFTSPMQMNIEVDRVDSIWISSLPFQAALIFQDERSKHPNQKDPEYIAIYSPVTKIPTLHDRGIEFIATGGRTPFYLDIWDRPGNLAIWGDDREEKQLLASYILHLTISRGQFATVIDLSPNSVNRFKSFTANIDGLSIDICEDATNIFETPEIPIELDDRVRQTLRDRYIDVLLQALETLVLTAPGSLPQPDCQLLLPILNLAIDAFFQDEKILQRYRLARNAGMEAQEWEIYPVLSDYLEFLSLDLFEPNDLTDAHIQAIMAIRIRIEKWLASPYATAIDSPSRVKIDAPLITLSASNLNAEEAIGIGALVAVTAIRRAIINFEKGSVLFHNETDISKSVVNSPHFSYLLDNAWQSNLKIVFAESDPANVFGANSMAIDDISYHATGMNCWKDFIERQARDPNSELDNCNNCYSSYWLIEAKATNFQAIGRIYFPLLLNELSNFKQDLDDFKPVDRNSSDRIKGLSALSTENKIYEAFNDTDLEDDSRFREIAKKLTEFNQRNLEK